MFDDQIREENDGIYIIKQAKSPGRSIPHCATPSVATKFIISSYHHNAFSDDFGAVIDVYIMSK